MFFAKIVVYDNYEKEGVLVHRPLKRAYEEKGIGRLIERGHAILIGTVDQDGIFHERFTGREIEYNGYTEMDMGDFVEIMRGLSEKDIEIIRKAVLKGVYREDYDIAYENDADINEINNLEKDRKIDEEAYESGKTNIPMYNEEKLYVGSSFLYKCKMLDELRSEKKK